MSSARIYYTSHSDATPEQLATLVKLTERYCVVHQTLASGVRPQMELSRETTSPG
jgi:uncharacterized OsmC-like protein